MDPSVETAPRSVPANFLFRLAFNPLVAWSFVACLAATLLFWNLGSSPLSDPDEARHAEIAREALVTGQFVTPVLAFQPYHDKPMPFYWLVAGSFWLFGLDEFAARLPSALAAFLVVMLTALWTRRYVGPLEGILAGTVLGTAVAFVALGRAVLVDMSFSAWVSVAAFYGGAWLLEGVRAGWPVWPMWAALGVAVLLKGPVAVVLVGTPLAAFTAIRRCWEDAHGLRPVRGLLVVSLMAGSWYLAAYLHDPEYLREFLLQHNVNRFVSGNPGHPKNPCFFFYTLPVLALPWSLFWPVAGRRVWGRLRRGENALLFCALWFAAVLLFFSASRSKLATYVLPLFPPAAVLTAAGLADFLRDPSEASVEARALFAGCALLAALGLLAPGVAYGFLLYLHEEVLARAALKSWVVLAPVSLASVALLRWRNPVVGLASVLGLTLVAEIGFYRVIAPEAIARYTLRDAAQLVRQLSEPVALFSWSATPNSLMFYSGQPVTRLAEVAEAAQALARPQSVLLTKQDRVPELLCVVRTTVYEWWLGANRKVLLSANPHPVAGGRKIPPPSDCPAAEPAASGLGAGKRTGN